MSPNDLNSRELERLATRVLDTLPAPKWWQWGSQRRRMLHVRAPWVKVLEHAHWGLTARTLNAVEWDVVRDCLEYGPFSPEEVRDEVAVVS